MPTTTKTTTGWLMLTSATSGQRDFVLASGVRSVHEKDEGCSLRTEDDAHHVTETAGVVIAMLLEEDEHALQVARAEHSARMLELVEVVRLTLEAFGVEVKP